MRTGRLDDKATCQSESGIKEKQETLELDLFLKILASTGPQSLDGFIEQSFFSPMFGRVIVDQLTQCVKVLVAGQVVANEIVGLPAAKQGKAGPDLHLHRVIQNLEV